MATLAARSSFSFGLYSFETVQITPTFNQPCRWVFEPNRSENASQKVLSRSYGPESGNYVVGAFGIPGTMTIFNDSDSGLFYQTNQPTMTLGSVTFFGNTTATSATTHTFSPTGAGTVTIAPATAGNIDNMVIGATTRRAGSFTAFAVTKTDLSGTPGNVTNANFNGRCAIAAAASSVVVTNTNCTANTTIIAIISQATADATLTQIVRVAPAAGSFTIYGNAAATANTVIDYLMIN